MDAYNIDNSKLNYNQCKRCGRLHSYNVICRVIKGETSYSPLKLSNDEARRSIITRNIINTTKSW
jgi:hypothetical protein